MQFERAAGKVALRGASKLEISSEAALQVAKEERSRRHLARQQPKSAPSLFAASDARAPSACAFAGCVVVWCVDRSRALVVALVCGVIVLLLEKCAR